MYIGAPSEYAQVYVPLSFKGDSGPQPAVSPPVDDAVTSDAPAFSSLVVSFDYRAGISVLEFRNSATGEVLDQVPSRKVVQEYIRHGASSRPVDASSPSTVEPAAPPQPAPPAPVASSPPVQTAAPTDGAAPSRHTG